MSRRDAINRGRYEASPFYTPAKPLPGQMEMPVGTVHSCSVCGSDHICDARYCVLEYKTTCKTCGGPESHTAEGDRKEEEIDAQIEAARQEREARKGMNADQYDMFRPTLF